MGRGGARNPPLPTARGGAGNPPFPAGRVPRGTGRPSLRSVLVFFPAIFAEFLQRQSFLEEDLFETKEPYLYPGFREVGLIHICCKMPIGSGGDDDGDFDGV